MIKIIAEILGFIGLLLAPMLLNGQSDSLRLAGLFTNYMVLQQDTDVAIWGWAAQGEQVNVVGSWGSEVRVMSDSSGRWIARLRTPKAGIGHRLEVKAGTYSVVLSDVAIGEVWLASGQSNMEMPLSGWPGNPILDSQSEIEVASNPEIRIFMVQRGVAGEPINEMAGHWLPSTEKTVPEFSATAYFFAKHLHNTLKVPVGVIHSSWGGTAIDSWIPAETLELMPGYANLKHTLNKRDTITQNTPSVLYNAMIYPLIPYSIKGFLWYQGESDTGNPAVYHHKFERLIHIWRNEWELGDIPFYFVQIAPFNYGNQTESVKLREAQFETLRVSNTGMVVTLDIGDPGNIHPANKQEVGRRLAFWASGHTYGQKLVYSGPLFKSMVVEDDEAIISFDHTADALIIDQPEIQNIQIAGPDRKFYTATVIVESKRLRLSHPKVPNPAAVRYAWDNTSPATLFNSAGLPASSFRSDRWD